MSEYQFQLNVKIGKGYDAHLLNIVGQSQEEFQENVKWVSENAAGIVSAVDALEGVYQVKVFAGNVAGTQVQQNQGQQQQQAPQGGPSPSCSHGEMVYHAAGFSNRTKQNYGAFYTCTQKVCKSVNP